MNTQKSQFRTLMAALALAALILPVPGPESDSSPGHIGTDPAHASSIPDTGTVRYRPGCGSTDSTPPESRLPDPPGSLAMDNSQLDSLRKDGFLDVLHPEGGLLRIELLQLEEIDALRTFHVRSDGMRGVITEREGDYFATIATPAGVYTLERRDGHTHLNNQQQLDLRNNPDERDYRHVPLV